MVATKRWPLMGQPQWEKPSPECKRSQNFADAALGSYIAAGFRRKPQSDGSLGDLQIFAGATFSQPQSSTQKAVHADLLTAREREHCFFLYLVCSTLAISTCGIPASVARTPFLGRHVCRTTLPPNNV